jgi:uncharacterized protein (TIGR02246 family)
VTAGEPTTPDPVELAACLVDAINARDFEAMAGFYAHDAIYDGRRSGRRMEGRAAIRAFLEEWLGVYESLECDLAEIRVLGPGVTFLVVSQRGRISGTTAWVEERFPLVDTWADGLIQRSTSYTDIDEARDAAERLAIGVGSAVSDESAKPASTEIRLWVEADSYDEFAAFIRRYYAPDAVLDLSNVGLGSFEGAAILAFFKEYWLTWDEHHHYLDEVAAVGRGVEYLVIREDGRMKAGGALVVARNAWVMTWQDGKVRQATMYPDLDEGRAAAERLAEERG